VTTIAADLETMASDSKVGIGMGVSYKAVKITRVKKMLVGAAGNGGDCSRLLEWAERDFKGPRPKWEEDSGSDMAVWALILRPDGLFFMDQDSPEPERIDEPFFAIGSGGKSARVAMLLGKTPEEAVALACQVDDDSGLPVQVLSLKDQPKKGTP
jgi:ATP-dependent protease HslVU (ClpYQ) peptidase subunit